MPDLPNQPANGSPAPQQPAPPPAASPAMPSTQPSSGGGSDFGGSPSSSGGQSGGASFREQFAKRGYDTTQFQSDDELFGAIDSQLDRYGELEKLAPLGQQYLEHQSSFEQWLTEKQNAEQAAASKAAEPPPSPWAPPPFEESWMKSVEFDEQSGRFLPRTIADREIANKVNANAAYQQKVSQHFSRNPQGFFDEAYGQTIEQKIQKALLDYDARQRQTQQATQIVQQNAERWIQRDEQGRDIGLTLEGQAVQYYAAEARQLGISNPAAVQQYAIRNAQTDMHIFAQQAAAQQGQQPAPAPQPQPGERQRGPDGKFLPAASNGNPPIVDRRTFVQNALGADHNPNRGAAELQLNGMAEPDFAAMARETMRERGLHPQNG